MHDTATRNNLILIKYGNYRLPAGPRWGSRGNPVDVNIDFVYTQYVVRRYIINN